VQPTVDLDMIVDRVRPLTMVGTPDLKFTVQQTLDAIDRGLTGAIVECGVWRGGCAAAEMLGQLERYGEIRRRTWLLDSFDGLPPATARDGPLALAYQADTTAPGYLDNCRASVAEVRAGLDALELPSDGYELLQGWFDTTTPALSRTLADEGIALLRLDGDWYESTTVCLEQLVPLVAEEGVIIIDDYYAWDGCARAVHDHLSRHDLAYRIRGIPGDGAAGAFMVKRRARTDPTRL
jgi:O-methyltransferase